MSNRIEVYISLRNLMKLEGLRQDSKQKGYSFIIDQILTKRFFGDHDTENAIMRFNKIIQGYEERINNLEFELRNKNKVKEVKDKNELANNIRGTDRGKRKTDKKIK